MAGRTSLTMRTRLRSAWSARRDPLLRWWSAYLVVWCAAAVTLVTWSRAVVLLVCSYGALIVFVWFTRVHASTAGAEAAGSRAREKPS